MPVLFICFIVFILWFRVKSKQADNETNNPKENFLKREYEANFTRKKDISGLDYLVIPENALPFTETDNMEEAGLQKDIKDIMSRKILNLSGISNTDLKLQYGHANLDLLAEYDQNFSNLLRCLDSWGSYLYNSKGDKENAKQVLEYSVSIGSDITRTYTTLASIYLEENNPGKVQSLIDRAENSDFFMKDSIISRLKKLVQEF
ncbi:MAG: hypothetical protein OSJ45_08435 [Lachnospiraceae bacterium]|nr:hypothetical protein [Lachnospiraceae bacterium]